MYKIGDKVVFIKNKYWGKWANKYLGQTGSIKEVFNDFSFATLKFNDGMIHDLYFDEVEPSYKNYVNKPINEIYPNKGENKDDFISRFMSTTKNEYPDIKQRFAVANSYWYRRNKN